MSDDEVKSLDVPTAGKRYFGTLTPLYVFTFHNVRALWKVRKVIQRNFDSFSASILNLYCAPAWRAANDSPSALGS
jgi:hypothetical protein